MKKTEKSRIPQDQAIHTLEGHDADGEEYIVRAVVRACDILKTFESADEELSLYEVARRSGLLKPTAFRLLHTLAHCGLLERRGPGRYGMVRAGKRKRTYRFGYASQSSEFSFSRLVSESIQRNAHEAGVELLVLNNRYNSKVAVRNAEFFVRERVDVAIEFQTDEHSAPTVAAKLMDAGIPIIAIDIPHPGAYYYGANNYRAGLIGGRHLAKTCQTQWGGAVDELLLLELPMAGPLPRSRLTGILAGVREVLPDFPDRKVLFINGNGQYEQSLKETRKHLRSGAPQHVLIGAMNDPSCLGALRAFEEAGRSRQCLAVGQNASIEARWEMRRPGSRLVGSVGYFPEDYGEAVISLALDKVRGKEIPPAVYVKHRLLTVGNVDQFYPNDALLKEGSFDSMLLSSR
jgi:ribose transport system substrate-binding protein